MSWNRKRGMLFVLHLILRVLNCIQGLQKLVEDLGIVRLTYILFFL